MASLTAEDIAPICHSVVQAIRTFHGDPATMPWSELVDISRQRAVGIVQNIIDGSDDVLHDDAEQEVRAVVIALVRALGDVNG